MLSGPIPRQATMALQPRAKRCARYDVSYKAPGAPTIAFA